jgi:MFS transporter, MHS family, proline/betaine transporter
MMTKYKFFAAISNTIIQYFNYALFGLSAICLSKNLMPGGDEQSKLFNFFALIILSILARPLGSFIFGMLGDIVGRKISIIFSGMISSFATILVSQIPNFEDIGIIASICLILSRMLFLASFSGEVDGIRIYISESVSPKKQYLSNGIVSLFTQSGSLLASIFIIKSGDNPEYWRIWFLLGGITGLLATVLRFYLTESNEFTTGKTTGEIFNLKLHQIILGQFKLFIKLFIIFGCIGIFYQFNIIFLPSYLLTIKKININSYIPFFIILYGGFSPLWGYLSDKYGPKVVVNFSGFAIVNSYIFMIYCIKHEHYLYIPYVIMCVSMFSSGISSPAQILIKKNINIAIRYRLFSVSHSIGSLLLSTPTGFICFLIANYAETEFIVLYPVACFLVGFMCLRTLFPRG